MQLPSAVIAAARAAQARWRLLASTQLAQWRIESGNGAHSPGNNPFGMKPRKGMNDPCQMLPTTEFTKGATRRAASRSRTWPRAGIASRSRSEPSPRSPTPSWRTLS